jgi:hypothetical protein
VARSRHPGLIAGPATRGRQTTTLIRLPHGHRLKLDDRAADANPDQLRVAVATFEHLISAPGCHYLSVGTVFADQQIGGTPDVAVRDHSGSSRSADFLTLGDLASAAHTVLIAPKNTIPSAGFHDGTSEDGTNASVRGTTRNHLLIDGPV